MARVAAFRLFLELAQPRLRLAVLARVRPPALARAVVPRLASAVRVLSKLAPLVYLILGTLYFSEYHD